MAWVLVACLAVAAKAEGQRQITFVTRPSGAQVYLEVSGRQRYEKYLGLTGEPLVVDASRLRGASHYRVTLRKPGYRDRQETVPVHYQGRWPPQGQLVLEPVGLRRWARETWSWALALVGGMLVAIWLRRRTPARAGGREPLRVGDWTLEEPVAEGGASRVYRARSSAGEPAAVKLLHMGSDRESRERYRREVLAWRRMRHPNIVLLYDFGEQDGRLWLALEWMPGGTLRSLIGPGGLSAAEAGPLLDALLAATEHAHDLGVVHRDIKPENVLLSAQGVPKLGDFGLARPPEADTVTKSGAVLGTLAYLAPEALEAEFPDPRSDQYALGVIAFELLSGRKPFEEREAVKLLVEQRARAAPPLGSVCPELEPAVAEVVDRMLQRDPAARFASVAEARVAWIRALGG